MTDLLDRLRKVDGSDEGTHWYRNPDGPEAAAEIERLRADRDSWMEQAHDRVKDWDDCRKDLAEAEKKWRTLDADFSERTEALIAAQARLSEAGALLRRWVGAANWRQGPEHRVVPLMDDTLIFLDKFNEED